MHLTQAACKGGVAAAVKTRQRDGHWPDSAVSKRCDKQRRVVVKTFLLQSEGKKSGTVRKIIRLLKM